MTPHHFERDQVRAELDAALKELNEAIKGIRVSTAHPSRLRSEKPTYVQPESGEEKDHQRGFSLRNFVSRVAAALRRSNNRGST